MTESATAVPIRVPRINVNDDTVVLVQWLVESGQHVEAGADLFVVETSKAATSIPADAAGTLLVDVAAGGEVRVGDVIGRLTATGASVARPGASGRHESGSAPARAPQTDQPAAIAPSAEGVRITKAAEALARELGIDPASIPAAGVIRESDVRAHHEAMRARNAREVSAVAPTATPAFEHATRADAASSAPQRDWLDGAATDGLVGPALLEQIARDREGFARLSSDFKIWLYRQHGAVIGHGVTIGAGTVIESPRIVIGDETSIGKNVVVRARAFVIGRLGEIGDNTKVLGGAFIAGDVVGIRFNAVFVGFNAARTCRIGDNTFIAYDTYINTEADVTIGRHVCLAPGVRLYTHRKWLSPLEGYSVGFAPIIIGDDSHLGSGVAVLPGVSIGQRVTVMANSVVATNAGDERLLAGIPAQPVGRQAAYRRTIDSSEKRQIVMTALLATLETLAHDGVEVRDVREVGNGLSAELLRDGQVAHLVFRPDLGSWTPPVGRCYLFSFSADALGHACRDITVFDLSQQRAAGHRDAGADRLRTHLGQHGLDFEPKLWREGRTGPGNAERFDFEAGDR